jgi:adenosylcobinamide kinase / adenosylcobinamide-phosphate guanylyltransferase
MIELILGGARSGKSALAEKRASESRLKVTYLATAHAGDEEMRTRIAHHQQRRPEHWKLIEAPLYLAASLREQAEPGKFLLVDCLTLWLSNLIFQGDAWRQIEAGETVKCPLFLHETQALLDVLPCLPGHLILVSNEVGLGIVPMGAVNRFYTDENGRLNQAIARLADQVTFVAAGLPLVLKSTPMHFP